MMLRIAEEMHAEYASQIAICGDKKDAEWSLGEWAALISHYATRQTVGDLHAIDSVKFRADLVKVGALAMAAIHAIDVQDEEDTT